MLATHPDLFCAAVIGDCGQNIGPGRGIAASCGMYAMKKLIPTITNKKIMEQFVGLVASQPDLDAKMILESTFQAGFFFEKGIGIVNTLESVNVFECIPNFPGPILFANGSKDHHDSQNKWLKL